MSDTRYTPEPPRIVDGRGWSYRLSRYAVHDGPTARLLGTIEESRHGWRPILPDGRAAAFVLPSRRQAADWLHQAAYDTPGRTSDC